jgi:hypothetical protein
MRPQAPQVRVPLLSDVILRGNVRVPLEPPCRVLSLPARVTEVLSRSRHLLSTLQRTTHHAPHASQDHLPPDTEFEVQGPATPDLPKGTMFVLCLRCIDLHAQATERHLQRGDVSGGTVGAVQAIFGSRATQESIANDASRSAAKQKKKKR